MTTSTYPGFTVGGVSKAALDRLTQGFAHEAFQLNIAVNGLLPARSIASEGDGVPQRRRGGDARRICGRGDHG